MSIFFYCLTSPNNNILNITAVLKLHHNELLVEEQVFRLRDIGPVFCGCVVHLTEVVSHFPPWNRCRTPINLIEIPRPISYHNSYGVTMQEGIMPQIEVHKVNTSQIVRIKRVLPEVSYEQGEVINTTSVVEYVQLVIQGLHLGNREFGESEAVFIDAAKSLWFGKVVQGIDFYLRISPIFTHISVIARIPQQQMALFLTPIPIVTTI